MNADPIKYFVNIIDHCEFNVITRCTSLYRFKKIMTNVVVKILTVFLFNGLDACSPVSHVRVIGNERGK